MTVVRVSVWGLVWGVGDVSVVVERVGVVAEEGEVVVVVVGVGGGGGGGVVAGGHGGREKGRYVTATLGRENWRGSRRFIPVTVFAVWFDGPVN